MISFQIGRYYVEFGTIPIWVWGTHRRTTPFVSQTEFNLGRVYLDIVRYH